MIYDRIDVNLIKTGDSKSFNNEDGKYLTPIYYDNSTFNFTLKNKYFTIDKIEENTFGKEFISVKSKELNESIKLIAKKLETVDPIQQDGSIRVIINNKTNFPKKNEIKDNTFDACLSITFPTIFTDKDKKTLQIHAKDIIVIKIYKDELEIDYDNLSQSM